MKRRMLRSRYGRPSWRQRTPIAEAAVTGEDGVVYAARQYPEAAGTYSGATDLTEYFFRRGNEWVPTARRGPR